jgi:tryptophan synthase alpha chain
VDVPPEEDEVLRVPAKAQGIDLVRLVTPTTNAARLDTVLNGASGYVYYVSFTGVTGSKTIVEDSVREAMKRLRAKSDIPCTVGFGIKTSEQAAAMARCADGAVVGSAIVNCIAAAQAACKPRETLVAETLAFCAGLAKSVHTARE